MSMFVHMYPLIYHILKINLFLQFLIFIPFYYKKLFEITEGKWRTIQGTEFILLGLTDDSQLHILIFLVLLLNYTLSMIGNLTIIVLTLLDSHLKTPMYFCRRNFSFLEISFTSACIPRSLITTVNREKTVSYTGCMAQLLFTYSCKLQIFSFWQIGPMTTMLPFASLCIVHPLWAAQFVISW